ncbi:MAG: leucyl aminopeptidase [Dehalococcoidia bacterium]|nr:leucyl aminopeptidase [Dehalococcoidia bacterium]
MKVSVMSGDIVVNPAEAVVVGLFEGAPAPEGAAAAIDGALKGLISQLMAQGEIKGKLSEVTMLHTMGKLPAPRVAVLGLGKNADLTPDRLRRSVAEACRALRRAGAKKAAFAILGSGAAGIKDEAAVQAITEGCILGLYRFRKYLSSKDPANGELEQVDIVTAESKSMPALRQACEKGTVIAEATNTARNMINEPSNFMTPGEMAEMAKDLAHACGLELTILEREQMRRKGMGAILAVAQGSQQPPKFMVLRYSGDPSSEKTLGLVGKGVTFDSGGISLKPSGGMGEMKDDMSGGAIVFATISIIARLKLKLNVVAICGATENMPSGSALKPGDVIKAMNGKSIEIISTDAEGRLTLADALSYAVKNRLSPLVDIATLTGACRIALGQETTGIFSNNQEFAVKLLEAASRAGERMWQMPMFEEYKEQNKSDIADIKNSGGQYGGAITAAQFLAEFVGDTPWVHLDIAGTSFTDKVSGYNVKGATGVAVRTLAELAEILAK